MKVLLYILMLPCFMAIPHCPDGIRKRKEFRDMDPQEWAKFKEALYFLHQNRTFVYDSLTRIHLDNSRFAHNTMYFFPWHRIYILMLENEIRKISPDIALPYWDWAFDSQDPSKSPIWKEEYLGTEIGSKGDCKWRCRERRPHCLVRNYQPGNMSTFHDRLTLAQLIQNPEISFVEFSATIEQTPHALVHATIGGIGGDMSYMQSPNDPLFWLHHAFIDKIWYDRQTWKNDWYSMDGQTSMSPSSPLIPFQGYTVKDSMNLSFLCYEYAPLSTAILKEPAPVAKFYSADNSSDTVQTDLIIAVQMSPLRANTNAIILPDRVPDFWIHHHHFDADQLRSREDTIYALTSKINQRIGHGRLSQYPWIYRKYVAHTPKEVPNGCQSRPNLFFPIVLIVSVFCCL